MANNKSSSLHKLGSLLLALTLAICVVVIVAEAKSISTNAADESVSAVIPSPNQEYGDTSSVYERDDIERRSPQQQVASLVEQQESEAASNEAAVPVYVSPFVRSERQSAVASFDPQESSHAPLNYAPRPSASIHLAASAPQTKDLKTSASYGHHHGHHGGHGYDHSGWLDMGAWTGGKGSFGWYADYPVGGKHGYGYGRK